MSAAFIDEPLCHIFNVSIEHKYVPELWKIGHIPKSNMFLLNLDDIRPISLLATPSKVFESFIVDSVKEVFVTSFGRNQFAYKIKSYK